MSGNGIYEECTSWKQLEEVEWIILPEYLDMGVKQNKVLWSSYLEFGCLSGECW